MVAVTESRILRVDAFLGAGACSASSVQVGPHGVRSAFRLGRAGIRLVMITISRLYLQYGDGDLEP